MEKRIFLAITISIAVLFGWAAIAPKLFPELAQKPKPKVAATTTAPVATTTGVPTSEAPAGSAGEPAAPDAALGAGTAPHVSAAPPATPVSATKLERTVIETPEYTAVLSNRGAQLISFKLNKYEVTRTEEPVELVKAREPHRTDYPFMIVPRDAELKRLNSVLYDVQDVTDPKGGRVLQYRYSDGRITMTKTFHFGRDPYLFGFTSTMHPPAPYRVAVGPGIRTLGKEEQDTQVVITGNGVVQAAGEFDIIGREDAPSVQARPGVEYIGVEDNYFLTALRPKRAGEGVLQRVAFFDAKSKVRRDDLYAGLNAMGDGSLSADVFFGPKEATILDRYNMGDALQFGWFDVIARFFLQALLWINQFTKNYGFAIIVLTFLIKIVLYPLQHKSIVSMKKMQKVQPKVEAIKARYKKSKTDPDQRNKMNQEMMQLYQKEGINPMAGCLPILLQLPIFWGFYNLLSHSIELRGAEWILWIRDLSEKDPTYVLPVLMTVTMFIQTYITPSTGDPAQRRIFLIMPLIFGFLFKDFPSGLVLYWLVQNVLTIAQQMIMNKWWKEHPAEVQTA
jgi:YidC/Oxa1 family membrane protein insertase